MIAFRGYFNAAEVLFDSCKHFWQTLGHYSFDYCNHTGILFTKPTPNMKNTRSKSAIIIRGRRTHGCIRSIVFAIFDCKSTKTLPTNFQLMVTVTNGNAISSEVMRYPDFWFEYSGSSRPSLSTGRVCFQKVQRTSEKIGSWCDRFTLILNEYCDEPYQTISN